MDKNVSFYHHCQLTDEDGIMQHRLCLCGIKTTCPAPGLQPHGPYGAKAVILWWQALPLYMSMAVSILQEKKP